MGLHLEAAVVKMNGEVLVRVTSPHIRHHTEAEVRKEAEICATASEPWRNMKKPGLLEAAKKTPLKTSDLIQPSLQRSPNHAGTRCHCTNERHQTCISHRPHHYHRISPRFELLLRLPLLLPARLFPPCEWGGRRRS